ncbi:MAG: amidohydrolase [Desulfarculus sp.]|nr:amidohydrolase [Desulfarculus sp.]
MGAVEKAPVKPLEHLPLPELCIHNGTILTMDEPGAIIEDGALLIHGGRITYCGPRGQMPACPGARLLDARGGLILPGLINGHTHAAMTLMRGLADDLPLEQWLTEHIFPAERNLTPEAVYWGSMLACAEMIRGGTTCFCDMYLFAHDVARAVDQAGLRAVIGEVIYDFDSPSYGPLENGFAVSQDLVRQYQDHPRIKGAIMPHALYTCSPSLLERAGQMAQDLDCDLNIHMSETLHETNTIVERHGARPLAHAASLGLVNQRLWIDHAVDFNADEIERLAQADCRISLLPESNMKLASGLANLGRMLKCGLKLSLGTDGCASNNDLDMFGEMDSCAKVHKAAVLNPQVPQARTVLELATRRGGQVFGQPGLGVLRQGALADVIVMDMDQPHLTPLYNPYSHLVYAASGADVLHSVCHGQVLMEDRRLLTMDEDEVLAKAREQARLLTGREVL